MGRSTQQVHAEINRIRRVLENVDNYDKSDVDLINELGINRRAFYRYKAKILQEDREVWSKIRMQGLETQALRILKSLNLAIKVNTEIALHSSDDRARIQATNSVIQNQVWIMQLLERGPSKSLEAKIISEHPTIQKPVAEQTV